MTMRAPKQPQTPKSGKGSQQDYEMDADDDARDLNNDDRYPSAPHLEDQNRISSN